MKIHEYQAKEIFRKSNIPVPRGGVANTVDEAVKVAETLHGRAVLKAQIHAGGRGKGGGIKIAANSKEAKELAGKMIGMNLVTHQTGSEGKKVHKLLIEEPVEVKRELYAGMVIDRSKGCLVIMASTEGGMDIEEVAAKTPEKILKEYIDPTLGLCPFQASRLAFWLGFKGKTAGLARTLFMNLYKVFTENDCSLVEINPLVETKNGDILALDGKINFDDNALYRHEDIVALRDMTEEKESEIEASKYNLNFIKLDGNVGCMVNGAGLAMATMDIIKLHGGEPANFLDVGGSTNPEAVENALKIIVADPNVKGILINIFGGIVRCDRVASGVIEAAKKTKIDIPIVIRLEGTNADIANKMLTESGLKFQVAESFSNAAKLAVETVR
ncbi:MAG: succinate--CoA ligase subunit beta [Candidatus Schekmanbacteria bacterium RBG_13_48_7]|uniref:Succinate--CoA ligase [ADP-forming] subunit beta n=1 Tax=Candidatus Schekmanbacteria bacterium RBG_13_48_7 TaxID=1817878 RepID=A0A1F7RT72_9BACT|nr:MAG: succinate--CoA ligase subunit beta [Candidatus Schekmanbacteria bacterium RBG_13_48_7]